MSKIRLYRRQIPSTDPAALDVTAKSATGWARNLAPHWSLFQSRKAGAMDSPTYLSGYYDQLQLLDQQKMARELQSFAEQHDHRIVLLCYCRETDPKCHVNQLIHYLVSTAPELYERG